MDTLKIHAPWMAEILPQGWPIGTSALITGPGGSGKPLIGNSVVSSWLREGGSVVFMSLQYPSSDFIWEGLRQVADLDLEEFQGRFSIIELDAELEGMEVVSNHRVRANLVKPAVWDAALEAALACLPKDGPGVLVSGSALNLLLFSPTYGKKILAKIKDTMGQGSSLTSLFSVSSSAKKEMIAELEKAADNLLEAHSTRDPFRLFLEVKRMADVSFEKGEVEVPISQETLEEVKAIADHSRKKVIPLISTI